MGSLDQNETRKEHRPRDISPFGPMQKQSRVSVKIVGLGFFSTNLAFVQVAQFYSTRDLKAEIERYSGSIT